MGDSRIYQFRNGRLVKRTLDHSYVQALVDRGEITEDQMDEHPQSHILLGCLGMSTTQPPIDIHTIDHLRPGDAIMACSDGLWHYFTPEEMGALIAERNPRESVELLIEEARTRARGTGDNISVAILKLEPLPKGHPLWSTENALITPHVGGNASAFEPRILKLLKRQLQALAAGETPANLVQQGPFEQVPSRQGQSA